MNEFCYPNFLVISLHFLGIPCWESHRKFRFIIPIKGQCSNRIKEQCQRINEQLQRFKSQNNFNDAIVTFGTVTFVAVWSSIQRLHLQIFRCIDQRNWYAKKLRSWYCILFEEGCSLHCGNRAAAAEAVALNQMFHARNIVLRVNFDA